MMIDVSVRGLARSCALRQHALRRIHVQLSRFGPEIRAVTARIGDVNGPKGGRDKRCSVTIRGRRFGAVTVDDMSGDVRTALDRALERAGRAVGRHLERQRAGRHRGARRRAS